MLKSLLTLTAVSALSAFAFGCAETPADAATNAGPGGGDSALQTTLAPSPPEGALALNVEMLAEGLVNPWSIAFLPDDIILISELPGRIRIIKNGVLEDEPVPGGPTVLAWGQGGLFDILPHPNFAETATLYFSYAYGTKEDNVLRVARGRFDGNEITNFEPLYETPPSKDTGLHYGGRLVWGPDNKLYVTMGEGSRYKEKAQDMSTSYGAVIRINPDGAIPERNPFFDTEPGTLVRPELYSKGHRNPQGLAYDAARDILWSHEHGARGGDEINIVKPGANYGWPIATYGIDYNGARITPFTEYEGTVQPFKYWTPSIAPSGLAVYRGDVFPEWDGDLLIGAMAIPALHRVILDGDKEVGEERYLVGERVRDVRVGPDGAIYVATEDRGGAPVGKILRLTPR